LPRQARGLSALLGNTEKCEAVKTEIEKKGGVVDAIISADLKNPDAATKLPARRETSTYLF
jgi:short-subunit dehydrogenase